MQYSIVAVAALATVASAAINGTYPESAYSASAYSASSAPASYSASAPVSYSASAPVYSASSYSAVWVTDIVTDYTTYCPAKTTFSAYGATYTVTEATTIVLPCPCTSSYLVTPTSAVYCSTCAPVTTASVYPVSSAVVSPVYVNSTAVAPVTTVAPTYSVGTVSPTHPASSSFTGAANSMAAPAGALAGVLGLAAYFL